MRNKIFLTPICFCSLIMAFLFIFSIFAETADARSRSGGRSFSRSNSFSRSTNNTTSGTYSNRQTTTPSSRWNTRSPGTGSFLKGLGGGLLGGFLGSMFFGHGGMGMGGLGGSGLGLIEILLIGGVIFFLFKKFINPKHQRASSSAFMQNQYESDDNLERYNTDQITDAPADPLDAGLREIKTVDPQFDEGIFKEAVQDIFFKVQAGWMHRDISVIESMLGNQLAEEYRRHFDEMKQKGVLNRLENIAVRKVEIVDAGVQSGYAFVTVLFTANLLDYTVEEKSGKIIEGNSNEPVKFQERWTFGTPVNKTDWRLEGIE
ncbi:MAG: Tim44 domain-containing protein [Desulfobacterales bacterium]|nr:Tim44 domain-containing protein [Desulfobacterales bacterium]